MSENPVSIVVLAAGKGTRMKSALPKVLHKIGGRSMLGHVLDLAAVVPDCGIAVVVGPDMEDVRAEALRLAPRASIHVQTEQRGTADAVIAARSALEGHDGDVIVLYADTPLITPEAVSSLRACLDAGHGVAVLGFEAADPTGYGRLLRSPDGSLAAIREHKDANEQEREVSLCNSGVMAFRLPDMLSVLDRIDNNNAKQEYYLTDAVDVACRDGHKAGVVVCPEDEVLGVNSRVQLAGAEAIFQTRARRRAMLDGVTMVAPETVWLSYDTELAADVVLEPNVFFGPGVKVEQGAVIKANCHLEGAHVGASAQIGPYARLRPGAMLAEQVRVGNFVEVKNTEMGAGAKANHLSYLGDGTVGAGANIGAGTIFCNYDGFNKARTEIGEGAFVGSNSSLVAPVKIGDGAYVGSGSVITKNVEPDALALERSTQETRPGWAAKFRMMMQRRRDKKRA